MEIPSASLLIEGSLSDKWRVWKGVVEADVWEDVVCWLLALNFALATDIVVGNTGKART